MKFLLYACVTICCVLVSSRLVFCQEEEAITTTDKIFQFPDKLFSKLTGKTATLNTALDRQTERYLTRLSKQEAKLRRKIAAKDSTLAKELFTGVEASYTKLSDIRGSGKPQMDRAVSKYASVYSSGLDSLNTSLNFLKSHNIANLSGNTELQKTLNSYSELQSRLNASEQARKYIAARRELLQSKLQELGMLKELNQFKKQAALYQAQLNEYKNILNEPAKLEQTLLGLVRKVPAFRDFFAQNSLLGSMFALPTSTGTPATIAPGLQTRAMVNASLISRFGSMEAVTQALQQSMPAAQSQLQQLKDKLNQYSSGSYGNGSSTEMPEQPVDPNKTRSFWRRVYFSAGMQSQKKYSVLPVTSDLSAALNFKLSEKKIIGVALAGAIGWGEGWRHIKLSSQGVSARFFTDVKLKGSFWLSANYEWNYRPGLSALDSAVAHGERVRLFNPAGLVGVSKIVSLKSKVAKKTKMSFLWDFLSYSAQVKRPAFTWRVEYALK